MAFVREKTQERTGYQSGEFCRDTVNNQCDFVMCYRTDDTMPARVEQYKKLGYVVHLMTGISWGHYTDYLYGEYDGRNHWDEAQTDRNGNQILHSKDVPYMVPTVSFCDYLTEKLKIAVDAGVEAIHVEEPEFWDRAGYSEAFKREYKLYYREEWQPPYSSLDARYKCSKLKQYLYTRAIDRVSSALKEYAAVKYGKILRFYVPTHSLINYTQWKIVSPEGKLADIPGVDGCIAQVWTGTSREKNWFNGKFKERTFETAYLEYGVMQELVKGTGRKMWFLHDPIEDNPIFDWNDYRRNYFCTVAASLLHPKINSYEICPWPTRVFEGKYPKGSPDAEPIPESYNTILNNMFNTLGNIENAEESGLKIGILCGDSQLYQREYPDCEFSIVEEQQTGTVLHESDDLIASLEQQMKSGKITDKDDFLKYMQSNSLPAFYGLALPLLKYGVPVRPVLADNTRRFNGYLDDYDVLLVSYEFMKPDYPDLSTSLARFVNDGGTLIYFGDGSDPYNKINSWWSGKFANPAEHLFSTLGVKVENDKYISKIGKGVFGAYIINPAEFLYSKEKAQLMRSFTEQVLSESNIKLNYKNSISVRRENYIISAVLDESVNEEPLTYNGLFADMFTPDFEIVTEKNVLPGQNTMLLDLEAVNKSQPFIIGTSVRINSFDCTENTIKMSVNGSSPLKANIRIFTPFKTVKAEINGTDVKCEYDEKSSTTLLSFESVCEPRTLTVYGEGK